MNSSFTRRAVSKGIAFGMAGSLFSDSFASFGMKERLTQREFDISAYDSILLPREHGQLTRALSPIYRRYPSRDHCMQMAAFFNAKKGLLVYSKDPDGRVSDWEIHPRRKLKLTFFGDAPAVEAIEIPPSIDAAAAVYRSWAAGQAWAKETKDRGEPFSWCVVASSPDSEGQSRYLESVYEVFPQPLGVWFTQYRQHAFDTMYPDYRAADSKGFQRLLSRARALGAVAMPYLNGLLWDERLGPFRRMGERVAIRDRFGQLVSYNDSLRTLRYACPAAREWRETILEARRGFSDASSLRTGGVYVDMVLAAPPVICWSDEHDHAPGDPGAWQRGVGDLLSQMDGVVMAEGCAEVYLAKTSSVLMHLYSQSGDAVPLWHKVYGAGPVSLGWSLPRDVSATRLQQEIAKARSFGVAALGSPWMTRVPEQKLMTTQVRQLLLNEMRRSGVQDSTP